MFELFDKLKNIFILNNKEYKYCDCDKYYYCYGCNNNNKSKKNKKEYEKNIKYIQYKNNINNNINRSNNTIVPRIKNNFIKEIKNTSCNKYKSKIQHDMQNIIIRKNNKNDDNDNDNNKKFIETDPEFIHYKIENFKNKNITALVFQGGGAKGIMYAGVIKALSDINILDNIDFYSGTSIGALTSLLLYLGYDPDYLLRWIMSEGFTYSIFGDTDISFNITYGGLLNICKNMINMYGMFDNYILLNLTFNLVKNAPILNRKGRGDETFKELYNITKKTLLIPGTNLNKNKVIYFSHMMKDDMPVYIAVAISMCIPIVFNPIYYNNNFWVDGGVIQNLPVNITKRYKNYDEILCIGIKLDDEIELMDNYIFDEYDKNIYNQNLRPYDKLPYYHKYDKYCINSLFSYFGALMDANNKCQSLNPRTDTSLIMLECSSDLTTLNFDLPYYIKEKYIKYAYNKTLSHF